MEWIGMRVKSTVYNAIVPAVAFILAIIVLHIFVRPIGQQFLLYLSVLLAVSIIMGYILFNWLSPRTNAVNPKERLIKAIGDYGILKTGSFILEHRGEATYVVYLSEAFNKGDVRTLPELMSNVIESSNIKFNRVVGILTMRHDSEGQLSREGYHLAPIIAYLLNKPYMLLYETKDESTNKVSFLEEGEVEASESVIIVDDVLTTGGSIMNAATYLMREKKIVVRDAFAFVSRPHGESLERVRNSLRQEGISLHFIIDSKELLDRLHKEGYIGEKELQRAREDKDFQKEAIA
jgi:uridine monophosphate synthetase